MRGLRNPLRAGVLVVLLLALCALPGHHASAHPLGNFTVNTYDGLVVSPGGLRIDHVEDYAEIPAAQAAPRIDRDGDGRLTAPERAAWAQDMCARAARAARVTAGGKAVRVASGARDAAARQRPGQAGLRTLRLECALTARFPLARGTVTALRFTSGTAADTADTSGPGWREVTARGDGAGLKASDVPRRSVSERLTRYPKGLLSSPLRQRDAALRALPGGPALGGAEAGDGGGGGSGGHGGAGGAVGALPGGTDRFTEAFTGLVERHRLTPQFALLALAVATVLGAGHALAPGHGKTVMAAYAAVRRPGERSLATALRIGATVTVTHTAGVLVLGALVATGSRATPLAIPWLTALSGLLVAVAGTVLLRRALRGRGHTHGHEHGHTHGHEHHPPRRAVTRDTLLLGFAGGMVPSPSAVLVLIGSGALGQLWFGLLLVLAYGTGLALTLIAVALLIARAGGFLSARLAGAAPRSRQLFRTVRRTAPTGTAALVVLLGAALTLRGLTAALA